MAKYVVCAQYMLPVWTTVEVEAGSEKEALAKVEAEGVDWWLSEKDYDSSGPITYEVVPDWYKIHCRLEDSEAIES